MKQRFLRGHCHLLYVPGCTEHIVSDLVTEGPLITRRSIYQTAKGEILNLSEGLKGESST